MMAVNRCWTRSHRKKAGQKDVPAWASRAGREVAKAEIDCSENLRAEGERGKRPAAGELEAWCGHN
jgi:hypothetical protein